MSRGRRKRGKKRARITNPSADPLVVSLSWGFFRLFFAKQVRAPGRARRPLVNTLITAAAPPIRASISVEGAISRIRGKIDATTDRQGAFYLSFLRMFLYVFIASWRIVPIKPIARRIVRGGAMWIPYDETLLHDVTRVSDEYSYHFFLVKQYK